MKIRIPLFLLLLIFASCKEEQKTRSRVAAPNVKNVRLDILNENESRILYGDTLKVKLHFDDDSPVRSVTLRSTQREEPLPSVDSLVYHIPTADLGGGYHGLRAEVTLENNTMMRGSGSVRVVLPEAPAQWGYRIIEVYPHDTKAYTQGLLYHNQELYESTGRYGFSDVRRTRLHDGEIIRRQAMSNEFFGEGLALYNNELYQLTWQENEVFVYDVETLEMVRSFRNEIGNGEGWGLCYDGEQFIFSDGSANLYFIDPETWTETRRIRVFDHVGDVLQLNELEFVSGRVYANILNDHKVAVINPETGAVQAYWEFSGILQTQPHQGRVDVFNGIAYRSEHSSFLVTGKLWPYMFEVAPVY